MANNEIVNNEITGESTIKKLIAAGILCVFAVAVTAQDSITLGNILGFSFTEVRDDVKVSGRLMVMGVPTSTYGLDAALIVNPHAIGTATGIIVKSHTFGLQASSPAGFGVTSQTDSGTGIRGIAKGYSGTGIGVEAISEGLGAALRISGAIVKNNELGHYISLYDPQTNALVATYRYKFHK
jgi:hypothetical protein